MAASDPETERQRILGFLRQEYGKDCSLARFMEVSYFQNSILILPGEAATQIAETHSRGYHQGLWYLAMQYETMCAEALLTNRNERAPGYKQPKSFSAWPRRHKVRLYREAAWFRGTLPEDVLDCSPEQRAKYKALIIKWHNSVEYVSHITGDTRIDAFQIDQICQMIALSASLWGP